MTITITKGKLAAAVVAVALLIPATAFATHSWPDVDDGAFYAEAVEWAKGNGMTTGCDGGTNFCPNDGVTRGENLTFAKRYHDLVAVPARPKITRLFYGDSTTDTSISGDFEKLRDVGSFTKTYAGTDILVVADSHGTLDGVFCHWQIRIDGATDSGNSGTGIDDADGTHAVQYAAHESWVAQGIFEGLSTGSHDVELWVRGVATSCIDNEFNFNHTVLVTEVETR